MWGPSPSEKWAVTTPKPATTMPSRATTAVTMSATVARQPTARTMTRTPLKMTCLIRPRRIQHRAPIRILLRQQRGYGHHLCPDDPTAPSRWTSLSGELEYLADYMHVYDGPDTTAALPWMDLNGTLDGLSFRHGCFRLHHHAHHHGRLAVLWQRLWRPHQLCGRLWLMRKLRCTRGACNYNPERHHR